MRLQPDAQMRAGILSAHNSNLRHWASSWLNIRALCWLGDLSLRSGQNCQDLLSRHFHVGSLWLLEIHAWKNEQNGMKELPINTGLLVFLREKTNVTLKNRTCGNARLLLLGAEAEALAKPLRQPGRTQSSSETQDFQA